MMDFGTRWQHLHGCEELATCFQMQTHSFLPFDEQERDPETIHMRSHCLEELAAGFQIMLSHVMSVGF
jgi:hypothetical protein